jgi:hypothetical protein
LDEALSPLNKTPVADLLKPHRKAFIITGGRRESYRDVFEWMLFCCLLNGVRNFQYFKRHIFYNSATAYLSAHELGVAFLETHLMQRLENIAARQVHSEDVELIFSQIEGPHELKDMVCKSISNAIWERRLRVRHIYKELPKAKGFEEFGQGVSQVIAGLKAIKKSSPEYLAMIAEKKEQAKMDKWRFEEREKKRTTKKIANKPKVPPSAVTIRGDQGYTITTQARVVNKGKNSHLRRLALPLQVSTSIHRLSVTVDPWRVDSQ